MRTFAFLLTALLPLSAFAQESPPRPNPRQDAPAATHRDPPRQDAPAATHRVKSFIYDAERLEGELPAPSGELITNPRPATFNSLIHVREHFIKEILASANQL